MTAQVVAAGVDAAGVDAGRVDAAGVDAARAVGLAVAGHRDVLRPHDLVRVVGPDPLVDASSTHGGPAWLATRPAPAWCVVRRAVAPAGYVPVGARGRDRTQRWAGAVPRGQVAERVTPADVPRRPDPARADLPALRALALVAGPLDEAWPGAWGPGGSVGFELVTGHPAVTGTSDLDVVVDTSVAPDDAGLLALLRARTHARTVAGARLDVQLRTPAGAVALDEWARDGGRRPVAVRTPTGPRLVLDPWGAR